MKPESRKEIAARLVVEAEGMVARQQELVAMLEAKQYRSVEALELLAQFQKALANCRRTLALLMSL